MDFRKPAIEVHNKIRGLSPFPTAWATLNGEKFNMYASEVGPDISLSPGELTEHEESLIVGCGTGTVILKEVQLPGTKRMSGQEFIHGHSAEGKLR